MTDMLTTAERYKLVAHYLQNLEWAQKLACSMEGPIRARMLCSPFLVAHAYAEGEPPEGADKNSVRFFAEPISWADQSVDLMARIERQQSQARDSLVEKIDAPLFGRLLAAPTAEWSGDGFLEAVDALSDGERRPLLVMSAGSYASFRKSPRPWIDSEECQSTTLRCGLLATIAGCPVFTSRHVKDAEEVYVVSRRPSQVMSPLEVGVRVAAYDAEAKFITFTYGARMWTQETPKVRRFRVGDL
jgi:hypothetical protein